MDSKQTLEELYDKYYRDVYHFALYFTNNKQEAEDITQDTFIKVMKNFHTVRDHSKIKSWILSIAKNLAIDLHRKKKFQNLIPGFLKEIQTGQEAGLSEAYMIRQEEWQTVQNVLLVLKPQYRSLVILRGLKELTVKETADILGYTELKVRVDYHRAIKMMKTLLNKEKKEGWDSYEKTK